jgi:uncharacterized protein (DUF4415 family)
MNVKRKKSARTSRSLDDPPQITAEWLEGADQYDGKKLVRRGRPPVENPRRLLSLRLPPKVIDKWKSTGPGWQTRMVKVLEQLAPKSRRSAV